MKIKQQNQIKTFLIEEFGVDNSNTLFAKQEKILNEIIKNTKNKSKSKWKTLIQTILPRIALYKALKEEFDEEKVYQHMQKYMIDIVAKQKHLSMEKMEKVPCFYFLYSNIFLRVVCKTDLWESTQKHDKKSFDVTMKKCLCILLDVEKIVQINASFLCVVSDYGRLKKIGLREQKH